MTIHSRQDDEKALLYNPYYFVYASLMSATTDDEQHLLRDRYTRTTTGSIVSSLYRLRDTDEKEGAFFVFPDLSVRSEGEYRLKFTLYEIIGKDVYFCTSIISKAFISTPLSRVFSKQGLKLRVRTEVRATRRSGSKRPSNGDGSRGDAHSQSGSIDGYSKKRHRPSISDDMDDSDGDASSEGAILASHPTHNTSKHSNQVTPEIKHYDDDTKETAAQQPPSRRTIYQGQLDYQQQPTSPLRIAPPSTVGEDSSHAHQRYNDPLPPGLHSNHHPVVSNYRPVLHSHQQQPMQPMQPIQPIHPLQPHVLKPPSTSRYYGYDGPRPPSVSSVMAIASSVVDTPQSYAPPRHGAYGGIHPPQHSAYASRLQDEGPTQSPHTKDAYSSQALTSQSIMSSNAAVGSLAAVSSSAPAAYHHQSSHHHQQNQSSHHHQQNQSSHQQNRSMQQQQQQQVATAAAHHVHLYKDTSPPPALPINRARAGSTPRIDYPHPSPASYAEMHKTTHHHPQTQQMHYPQSTASTSEQSSFEMPSSTRPGPPLASLQMQPPKGGPALYRPPPPALPLSRPPGAPWQGDRSISREAPARSTLPAVSGDRDRWDASHRYSSDMYQYSGQPMYSSQHQPAPPSQQQAPSSWHAQPYPPPTSQIHPNSGEHDESRSFFPPNYPSHPGHSENSRDWSEGSARYDSHSSEYGPPSHSHRDPHASSRNSNYGSNTGPGYAAGSPTSSSQYARLYTDGSNTHISNSDAAPPYHPRSANP
ncbi:hypothetical protein BSLG_001188 [Batrachochytrium salamandrivorans]|nr:hypothetical protein BSLG_001188 [Batrachochytrium salamandrivorans]